MVNARALLVALTAVCGCTDERAPGPSLPESRTGCGSSSDCRGDLRCVLGACTGDSTPPGTFALRVVPPQNLKSGAIEVQDLQFEAGSLLAPDRPLVLPDRAVLVGRALTSDTPPVEVAVEALAFSRVAVAPEGRTIQGRAVTTSRGPRFTFTLAPCWPDFSGTCKDTLFSVRLTPDSALLPPADFRDLTIGDDRPEEERPFTLPGTLTPPSVTGDLRLPDGTPLHDLTIFGVDESGQRVTTSAKTDAEGRFEVRYWPFLAGHTIRLLATSTDPMRPLPRLGLDVTLPAGDAVAAPAHVVLPEIGATFTTTGVLTNPDGEPVVGAHLRFETETAAGLFVADALSAADGSYSATVYPGDYLVDIQPLLGTGLRLQRTALTLEPDDRPLSIRVKPLVPVTGRIIWPDGAPLAETRVEAHLMALAAGRPELVTEEDETPPTRVVASQTDADGAFTLLLDPGEQALVVTPIAGLGLPTTRRAFTVPVTAGLALDLGEVTVLPAAVITLTVHDIRDVPVAGAVVQAWRTDVDPDRKVAEGATGSTGQVVLRVPDETAE